MSHEDDETPSTALVDIEDLFRKKRISNTSIVELAISSLQPYIDELPQKRNTMTVGASVSEGGNFSGSFRSTGVLKTKGIVVSNKLTTAGTSSLNDLIIVRENTLLAGTTKIKGNALFGGKTRIAGVSHFMENIIASTKIIFSGTVKVEKQIITDGKLVIAGTTSAGQIQSLNSIYVRGKIFVDMNVESKSFHLTSGGGEIGGDLIAQDVGIGRDRQLNRYIRNYERERDLNNPVELFKYLKIIIGSTLFDRRKRFRRMEIHGDIIAHDLFLENTIVYGNINAIRVTIGDNVEIRGKIEYSESLNVLTSKEYDTEQIKPNEIKYLVESTDIESKDQ